MRTAIISVLTALLFLAGGSVTQAQDDTLSEIQKRSELVVLVTNNIPYSYKEPGANEWIGYNIDLINRLGELMKWKIQLVESNWATLIPSLQAKKADMIIAPMTLTTARGAVMNLTKPTVFSGNNVIVRSDEMRFKEYEDLNKPDVTFAVFPNATETMARSYFPNAQIKIISGDNPNAPRMEVLVGRADASITDTLNAKNFVSANPKSKLLTDVPFMSSGLHWGVRSDDQHFVRFIDTFLQDMTNLGTLKALGAKWGVQSPT